MNRRVTRIVTCLSLSALLLTPALARGDQGEWDATEPPSSTELSVSSEDVLDDAQLVASPETSNELPEDGNVTAPDSDTTPQTGGWVDLEDGRHWVDPVTGEMVASAWVEEEGVRYWIGADGIMATSCWHAEGNNWWWLGADGRMTTGWATINGSRYWFDPMTGIMGTEWVFADGLWSYVGSTGVWNGYGQGWAHVGDTWLYLSAGRPNTGWLDLAGARYWLDPETGVMAASAWVEDGGSRYWAGADGRVLEDAWHAEGDDWWWLGADGRMLEDAWHRSGSDWYWMGADGRMVRGWADLSSGSYYFSSSGIMVTSKLVRTLGGIHWIGPDGTPLSGWIDTPDGRFYFDPSELRHPAVLGLLTLDGVDYFIDAQTGLVRDAWAQLSDGSSAYAGADGVLTGRLVNGILYVDEGVRASGFTSLSGSTFYADPATGRMARGWQDVGGSRYWLDPSTGIMASSCWHAEGDDWWWLGADGRMLENAWHRSGSAWYWMGADGRMVRGWMSINGSWYFFSPSGIMLTGWHAEGGSWWWFDASGIMQTGWVSVGGSWYWMGSDGRMAANCWHREGSDWYWLDANGKMATGWRLIGGTWYWFGGDGRWNEMSVLYPDMFNIAQNYTSQTNYLLLVDTSGCRTAVYYRTYGTWTPIREWICSPGAPATPTVKGQFTVTGKGYSFGSGYTCYYYTQFYGDYLFHSIKYNQGTFVVQDGRLGQQLSHGCVRLALENAKWIYDNIPYRTKVVIY